MNPLWAHHLMAAVLWIVVPLLGLIQHRHLVRQIARGRNGARTDAYIRLIAGEWIVALAALAVLIAGDGNLEESGLCTPATVRFWIGSALVMVLSGLVVLQTRAVISSAEALRAARRQIAPVNAILPHNAHEAHWFSVLSVTAGICEEIVYRGFLLSYLGTYLTPWGALPLSALAFGLGHAEQGIKGIVKTGAMGLVLALLVLWTGSILPSIVLHVVIDLTSGRVGRRALETSVAVP